MLHRKSLVVHCCVVRSCERYLRKHISHHRCEFHFDFSLLEFLIGCIVLLIFFFKPLSRQNMFSNFEHFKSVEREPHLTRQQGNTQTRQLWGGREKLLMKMPMLSFTFLASFNMWCTQMWQLDSRKPPLYYRWVGQRGKHKDFPLLDHRENEHNVL